MAIGLMAVGDTAGILVGSIEIALVRRSVASGAGAARILVLTSTPYYLCKLGRII